MLREAAGVAIPERLALNVPIQVTRAKLAVKINDRRTFDEVLANLNKTRIDPTELARVSASFG